MSFRKTLVLCLAVFGVACRDVIITEPAPIMPADFHWLVDTYWKDSLTWSAPLDVMGITGHPVDGCAGGGFSHAALDPSLPQGERDTILVIQMNQNQLCPNVAFNSYSWMISFITRRSPGYGYPITVTADTMLFIGTFSDSNHWSGKIVLAIAKTQIGTWTRVRLVPSSLSEEMAWRALFDNATKNMRPGSFQIIRAGRYALP